MSLAIVNNNDLIILFYIETNNQESNNPAITNPVPQPAQMKPGVSRSDLLSGNEFRFEYSHIIQSRLTAPEQDNK